MWTHLERQKGGIGMRGPGETEIETDRRIVRDRIALLKEKIKTIDRQMSVQRGNRGAMVRVALVGYTNVGKSTLMNAIGKSDVFVENKLFATLDTTVRKVVIKNMPFLLSDTVGFIRKLPTQLIESFKSTLDEVREADLLLHIVDISHADFEDHIEAVNKILADIKSNDKPIIMVFNKIDAYKHLTIEEDDLITERTKRNKLGCTLWVKTKLCLFRQLIKKILRNLEKQFMKLFERFISLVSLTISSYIPIMKMLKKIKNNSKSKKTF
jgi:GTP-binding protein HflX